MRFLAQSGRCFVLAGLVLWSLCPVAVKADDIPSLEHLVRDWVALRRELANTEANWVRDKEILAAERDLLLQELEKLGARKEAQATSAAGIRQEYEELQTRHEKLQDIFKQITPAITAASDRLLRLEPQLPSFLQEQLRSDFLRLRQTPATAAGAAGLASRTQTVLRILADLQQAAAVISLAPVLITGSDGEKVQMEALYFGLAGAFAVSPDDNLAAVGRPGADAWEWVLAPELATTVREGIAVYKREQPASLVRLPLAASGKEDE
jgi:hypothetical protein